MIAPERTAQRVSPDSGGRARMSGRGGARRVAAFLLAILAVATGSGCARIVIGPGDDAVPGVPGSDALGSLSVLRTAQGPDTGPGATAHSTLASSLERVVGRADMKLVYQKTVYVAGWGGFVPTARQDRGRRLEGASAHRAESAYAANLLAFRVVAAGGRATDRSESADLWLIPWIRVLGGQTTHRELRYYGYPVYIHEEDWRLALVSVLLYDPRTYALVDLTGGRARQAVFDSFILDIFGVRFGY